MESNIRINSGVKSYKIMGEKIQLYSNLISYFIPFNNKLILHKNSLIQNKFLDL